MGLITDFMNIDASETSVASHASSQTLTLSMVNSSNRSVLDEIKECEISEEEITLERGMDLLKYGRYGKPKWKKFCLDKDHSYFMWKSNKKSLEQTRIAIGNIREIVIGSECKIVNKKVNKSRRDRSFTIYFGERLHEKNKCKLLTLTAKSKEDAMLCKRALRKVSSNIIV